MVSVVRAARIGQGVRRLRVRRNRRDGDGKIQWNNLPIEKYRNLSGEEVHALVYRLNSEQRTAIERAKQVYQIKHRFITQALLDEYAQYVYHNQTDLKTAARILDLTQRSLHFFIHKLNLPDPVQWKKQQALWGFALLNQKPKELTASEWEDIRLFGKDGNRSAKTIKDFVQFVNQFIRYIHDKTPELFPLIVLQPISKPILKKYEATRKLDRHRESLGQYINDDHWQTIRAKADAKLLPFLQLAVLLGPRASELLGMKTEDVRNNSFLLQRQPISTNEDSSEFGPTKNRKVRKIPYWNTSAKEIHGLIKQITKLMHPNTLSRKVSVDMKRLGFTYTLHDFRRTWITNSLRDRRPIIEVRDAAGHADIQTTNLYAMRDEDFDSEIYQPEDD